MQSAFHWVVYALFAALAVLVTILSSQIGLDSAIWKLLR